MFGGAGELPERIGAGTGVLTQGCWHQSFLVFLEQAGELGNTVPAFNLNGFDFCGFVSPFMLIKYIFVGEG